MKWKYIGNGLVVLVVLVVLALVAWGIYWGIEKLSGDWGDWSAWTSDCNPLERAMGMCSEVPNTPEDQDCFDKLSETGYMDYFYSLPGKQMCPIYRYMGSSCDAMGQEMECSESDDEGVFCDLDLPSEASLSGDDLSDSDVSCAELLEGNSDLVEVTKSEDNVDRVHIKNLREFCAASAPGIDGASGLSGPCGKTWQKICGIWCAGEPYTAPPAPLS